MRFWFDTEFIEDGRTIDLISIGIVSEDGREFYAESADCDRDKASDWVRENVFPYLTGPVMPRAEIARRIVAFVGAAPDKKPEFWGYFADYDWVALCQLFGTMMDLPRFWPMFCMDVKQLHVERGKPTLTSPDGEHNALVDARWNKDVWAYLTGLDVPI